MASIKYKTSDGYVSIPMSIEAKTNEENGNGIGTCSTSSGTALEVVLSDYNLIQNGFVAVTFANDVPAGATLNINSKGAKPIYYKGSAITADTIKADDTVIFAYNGTNYVVTSLGGSGEDGEIVVVRCSASDDASVAGQTITINGTQYTLDATGIVSTKISYGTQYSISAGSWTDYITPTTKTFTANLVLREVSMEWEFDDNAIDLGLPSGLRWRTMNLGAENPWEVGDYFSWGNVVGHNHGGPATGDYSFDLNTYNTTSGASLEGDIPTGSTTYDAASAILGNSWKMPSHDDWQELVNNTDRENITLSGIDGTKCMKKTDHSIYIFLPKTGYYNGTTLYNGSVDGNYRCNDTWSPIWYVKTYTPSKLVTTQGNGLKEYGYVIRPVR